MAFAGIVGATASSGRFVPPITVARTGLGLSAGQYKLTTGYNAGYIYNLTGTYTGRSGDLITLSNATSSGTVTPQAPKGIYTGTTVNVARTPYTYHASYQTGSYCTSNWSKGQCASWGGNHHFNGNIKNSPPTHYTDSEGEWWRIW